MNLSVRNYETEKKDHKKQIANSFKLFFLL